MFEEEEKFVKTVMKSVKSLVYYRVKNYHTVLKDEQNTLSIQFLIALLDFALQQNVESLLPHLFSKFSHLFLGTLVENTLC